MRLLAIETASEIGGVALLDGDRVLGERRLGETTSQHAASILVELSQLQSELDCPLEQIDAIALSIGPGSFTGLRIGLATALGLCFETERRIVPVPTLAALSLGASATAVVPMLDARKGEVYTALYTPLAEVLLEDRVCPPLDWLRSLAARPEASELCFLGTGARLFQNEIRSQLGSEVRILESAEGELSAAKLGRLGVRMAQAGHLEEPAAVKLRYLRAAEAEEKRRAGHL